MGKTLGFAKQEKRFTKIFNAYKNAKIRIQPLSSLLDLDLDLLLDFFRCDRSRERLRLIVWYVTGLCEPAKFSWPFTGLSFFVRGLFYFFLWPKQNKVIFLQNRLSKIYPTKCSLKYLNFFGRCFWPFLIKQQQEEEIPHQVFLPINFWQSYICFSDRSDLLLNFEYIMEIHTHSICNLIF